MMWSHKTAEVAAPRLAQDPCDSISPAAGDCSAGYEPRRRIVEDGWTTELDR